MTNTVPSIFAAPPAGDPSYTPSAPYTPAVKNASAYTPTATAVATPPNSTAAPPQAGTAHNLPQNVRDVAKPRGRVIAWSHLDPALEGEISKFICCQTFGVFILPCFWCHLICVWPCLLFSKVAAENAVRSQYWILTETELKVVSLDHDQCCCPNAMKTGDVVKTVPLDNITDCGLDARGTGWVNQQAGDVPSVYVDTASSGGPNKGHEAVGIGLKDYDWLVQQILQQRDVVKHGGGGMAPSVTAQSMSRPGAAASSNKPTAERIQELAGLRENGIITEAEFQQQRQAIIASI